MFTSGAPHAPVPPAADMVYPLAMSWARRLKRVFGVEIECCARCGGQLKILASIEEPQLIAKILSHLERAAPEQYQSELPRSAELRRNIRPGYAQAHSVGSLGPDGRLKFLSARF